jgi:hypothetical protein
VEKLEQLMYHCDYDSKGALMRLTLFALLFFGDLALAIPPPCTLPTGATGMTKNGAMIKITYVGDHSVIVMDGTTKAKFTATDEDGTYKSGSDTLKINYGEYDPNPTLTYKGQLLSKPTDVYDDPTAAECWKKEKVWEKANADKPQSTPFDPTGGTPAAK